MSQGGSSGSGYGASSGQRDAGSAGTPPEAPNCEDGRATADETDDDCGGRTCQPCADGGRCLAGSDCRSGICTNQVCQPPTCTDLAMNGDETDLNCGGDCPKCPQGRHCVVDADCATASCVAGSCESRTCTDGVLRAGCPLLVDNTAYVISPGHAPSKCIDNRRAVVDGVATIIYRCNTQIQQTFWAVARADGFFALRSALSGKCLQLRAGSAGVGTPVEQATCDYSDAQLWRPSIVDASLMQLASKASGLGLDVAGANVAADNQAVVLGELDGSADTHWRAARATASAYIALYPNGNEGIRVRHDGALTSLTDDDMPSAHWKVVPGLHDAARVSFQSRDDPGRYLRHAQYRLWTDLNDGSAQFQVDATFRFADPLAGTAALSKAIEAINYPGFYWRHEGDAITLRALEETSTYKYEATWWISTR